MTLYFPFDKIRPGQAELIELVTKAIDGKKHLVAHAPTGIGKTAAVLSPALTAAIKNKSTVIFVTPKHTQHRIAIETLKLIKEKYKLSFSVIDLIGKRWMCIQSGIEKLSSSEFGDYCRALVEHDNCEFLLNTKKNKKETFEAKKVLGELGLKNPLHIEEVTKICKKNNLCPYEISCMFGKDANVIIADYFHVLDSPIRTAIFDKMEKKLERSIIIFDEAHNLPERCRHLLSVNLSTINLSLAGNEATKFEFKSSMKVLDQISQILKNLSKDITPGSNEKYITKDEFLVEIEKIISYDLLIEDLKNISKLALENQKKSYTKSILFFLESWLGEEEGYTRILGKMFNKKGQLYVNLSYQCLDPSLIIEPIAKESTIIALSGTLAPVEMYQDLLGLDNSLTADIPSPFPQENILNLVVPDTSTKYTLRNEQMYRKISNYCSKITNLIPGNSIVFFPSYQLRDSVNKFFQEQSHKTIFLEQSKMTKNDREELLNKFKDYKDQGAVLLGVSSGSFSEGIDLKGDLLKCVIVAGLPLSVPDLKTKSLIEYYNIKFERGWDYGYIFPAIIKTLQSAGRCIRSETDRGVIVFLDERFAWTNYRRCFPQEMNIEITTLPEIKIKEFFS